MANVDRPNGFRPVGTLSGSPWQGSVVHCISDADNLFIGDIVKLQATGYAVGDGAVLGVDRMSNGATDVPVGVVVGWDANPSDLGALYHAASTTYKVHVCTAPDVIMEAQGDSTQAIPAADIGMNYDVTVAAGSTTSGASGMEVDSDSEVTTAATPLKLLAVTNTPDNDISAANTKVTVMFNLHSLKSVAGTTGV